MSKEMQKKTELLKMKDVKSIDDFSFDKVDVTRGITIANYKEKCLDLCQNYLGGIWLKQTVDTIEVKRLSGGLTNQLFYCALKDPSNSGDVPNEVAVRFYGPKHFNNEDEGNGRLTDMIVSLMVSQKKLGPHVYGIFEAGEIQSFYKHRHLKYAEQQIPKITEQLFRKLAKAHAMKVPIKKDHTGIFQNFDDFYKKARDQDKLINELNLETLMTCDLKKEIEWIKTTIINTKSPVVFSHGDLFFGNIMVTEPNDEVILCDFEYSGYGYRGFDFATVMIEWNRKESKIFKSNNQIDAYPDDNQLKALLKPYIEESKMIFGKSYSEDKINSMEQLVKEVKVFSLVADLFLLLFCIQSDNNEEDGFPIDKNIMMEVAEQYYKSYFELKSKFIQDKVC